MSKVNLFLYKHAFPLHYLWGIVKLEFDSLLATCIAAINLPTFSYWTFMVTLL
jgi:hypothetical protein